MIASTGRRRGLPTDFAETTGPSSTSSNRTALEPTASGPGRSRPISRCRARGDAAREGASVTARPLALNPITFGAIPIVDLLCLCLTEPADQLRAHGIQVTAQRLAVLRAVAAQPHVT